MQEPQPISEAGDLTAAEAVFDRMRRLLLLVPYESELQMLWTSLIFLVLARNASIKPNLTSYNSLVDAFAQAHALIFAPRGASGRGLCVAFEDGNMKMAVTSMSRMTSP